MGARRSRDWVGLSGQYSYSCSLTQWGWAPLSMHGSVFSSAFTFVLRTCSKKTVESLGRAWRANLYCMCVLLLAGRLL